MEFKVVLVGDSGCGKDTYIKRIQSGEFNKKYIPTQGATLETLTFATNHGNITFNVMNCAGQEKFLGLGDVYYLGAQAVMFMFDLSNHASFTSLAQWARDVGRVVDNVPIAIVGAKADIQERVVKMKEIKKTLGDSMENYFAISSRSNTNLDQPWVHLARKLTGFEDLVFTEMDALQVIEMVVCEDSGNSSNSGNGKNSNDEESVEGMDI